MTAPKIKRLYCTRVRSNLQGGCDLTLSPLMVLLGENGAGKDTILRSIELALVGSASDLAGKDGVRKASTLRTLGADDTLTAVVTLSDGSEARWAMTGAKVESAMQQNAFPGVYPLGELRDLLAEKGSDAKKEFFLRELCADLTPEEIRGQIPAPLQVAYDRFARSAPPGRPADVLGYVGRSANADKLQAGRDLRAAEAVLDSVLEQAPSPPSSSQLAAAETEAARLYEEFKACGGPTQDVEALREVLGQWNNYRNHMAEALHAAKQELASLPGEVEGQEARDEWTRTRYEALVLLASTQQELAERAALPNCMLCEQPVDVGRAAEAAKHSIATAQAWLEAAAQRTAVTHRRAELAKIIAEGEAAVAEAITNEQKVGDAVRTAERAGADQGVSRTVAEAAWRAAQAHFDKLRSDVDRYDGVHGALQKKAEAAMAQDENRRLQQACQEATSRLVGTRAEGFVARVRRYMPPEADMPNGGTALGGGTFHLDLDMGEVGLLRGPHLHTALCGAEWTVVTTAIACALSEARPLSVIVTEDRSISKRTLGAMMAALSKAPAQVIIPTTTVPPRRKGWVVHEVKQAGAGNSETLPSEPGEPTEPEQATLPGTNPTGEA